MSTSHEILCAENITKEFYGVKALDNVSIRLNSGEVHAIVGENGAGKSTLMKILAGIYHADSGAIYIKGEKKNFHDPLDAINCGITLIHQELMPVKDMTVSENVFLGREPTGKFLHLVQRSRMQQATKEILAKMNISIDPKAKMRELHVAETQLIEIAKALSYETDILIMDEPTSSLFDHETENLLKLIERLKNQGVAIVYISHKLDEVFRVADQITVLCDGKYMGTYLAADTTNERLLTLMAGREMSSLFPPRIPHKIGQEKLRLSKLEGNGFSNINFHINEGEVIGIAGLMGSGRTEILESIFGLQKITGGALYVNGKKATISSPQDALAQKIALVPEDRKLEGLNLLASVKHNLTYPSLKNYCKGNIVSRRAENEAANKITQVMGIKTSGSGQSVNFLSGGNQQKVVIGKWMLTEPDIILLDEPTKGIDVGAKYEIYGLINQMAAEGKSIIVVSSELTEIIGVCDRIIALKEGHISGEFVNQNIAMDEILKYMV